VRSPHHTMNIEAQNDRNLFARLPANASRSATIKELAGLRNNIAQLLRDLGQVACVDYENRPCVIRDIRSIRAIAIAAERFRDRDNFGDRG
jgi:hypothetical protein